MLRWLPALAAVMVLCACAPFHRPLDAAARAKVPEVELRVVVAQESFMFSAPPSNVSGATGGGLIGALIDSSVQQSRQKDMSAEVQAIVGPLLGYDYRAEAQQALAALGPDMAGFPLKIASAKVLATAPTKDEQAARIAATRTGPAFMVLLLQYALEPGLGAFTARTSAMLWQGGNSEPVYRSGVIYQTPIGGNARSAVLRRLTADDGRVLRTVMRESLTQTLQVLGMDIAGARSGPVKQARFNANGEWVTLAGQGFDDQPGRVSFRDQDGAIFTVRSNAP